MDNPHILGQKRINDYWKNLMSESQQEQTITNERRWALWLSMKRDALMEQGFSRSEAMGIIRSMMIKPDPVLNVRLDGIVRSEE